MSKNEVTSCAQTKNGSLNHVKPGALSWTMVTIIFIEPRREDVIRNIIPRSHMVCPDSNIESGG